MNNIYRYVIIAIVAMTAFCSCGKDVIYDLPDGDKYNHVYLLQAVNYPFASRLFMVNESQTLHYSAFYSGYEAPKDIKVNFEVRPELVAQYNEQNLTSYEMLPEGSYQMGDTEAVIPAGGCRTGLMNVTINTFGYMEAFKEYLLPITLTTDDMKINEKLSTVYYVVSAAYEPGNVPYAVVGEGTHDAAEMFSFNDKCLIARAIDGSVYRYGYDATTGMFAAPTTLHTDWDQSIVKLMAKGPGNSLQVCNFYDTWITYECGEECASIPDYSAYKSVISGGTFTFKSLVPSHPSGLLAVLVDDGRLLYYKMSNDGHSYVSIYGYSDGMDYRTYKHLIMYGDDLIAVDSDGDMWLHEFRSNNTYDANRVQIGSGWDDFTHIMTFGTDLIGRTKSGELRKYEFDMRGFWALK